MGRGLAFDASRQTRSINWPAGKAHLRPGMNSSRQLTRLLRPQVSARLALLRPEKLPNIICWGPGQAASAPARQFNTAQRSLDVGKDSGWAPQKYTVDHFYDLSGVRSLIRVSGPDTLKFINGLCTSFLDDKDPSSSRKGPIDGFYTSFLKPQVNFISDSLRHLGPSFVSPKNCPL